MMQVGLLTSAMTMMFFLTGCNNEEAQAKLNNPQTINIGEFDGCEVKFVDRGYESNSFYIAKCGNTTTTTRHWRETRGKSQVNRSSTVITQEIESLQEEKKKVEMTEKAMSKLSDEEKKALGLIGKE